MKLLKDLKWLSRFCTFFNSKINLWNRVHWIQFCSVTNKRFILNASNWEKKEDVILHLCLLIIYYDLICHINVKCYEWFLTIIMSECFNNFRFSRLYWGSPICWCLDADLYYITFTPRIHHIHFFWNFYVFLLLTVTLIDNKTQIHIQIASITTISNQAAKHLLINIRSVSHIKSKIIFIICIAFVEVFDFDTATNL